MIIIRFADKHTQQLNNGEKETVYVNSTDRREIEELTGRDIEKLTNEQIKSQLRFINA